jgi:hypothetical protein
LIVSFCVDFDGRLTGSEIEKAMSKLENERSSALVCSLLAIEKGKLRSVIAGGRIEPGPLE